MTAITIGSSRSYIRNVHAAVHDLVVALLALDRKRPADANTRHRPHRPEGASLHQAYADVFAAQALSKEAPRPSRPGRGMSHAMLPYHLWSAPGLQD
ncbi:hypothetical protein [Noviherbaspirillum malthae]|uniref:hypothetical protein n=1 Tax=Noviherbaspirillum malthae TaxID=1260987 RepID=UPI00188EF4F8|nr:hypothetical protein [Noviherbaspirillum malthae]